MDARDEVKSRLSIEDVIGRYVELKKAGRNFKALSPFNKEKTPSFIVSPDKQIWHDFSSGKGGDVFSFVMEVEGLDFRGALELLARRAGVDLEQFDTPNRQAVPKSRLYTLLELATKFYQVQFGSSTLAVDYVFKQRKFTKTTALNWQLGYSPNTGDAVIKFLKSKDYSDKEINLAGLSSERYSRANDMFRSRLMVPLADSQGRVIGYTARQLEEDDKGPKYINTPQTVLYDKSRHIYGLHLAKEAIRSCGYVVVVEGNLDVIASHQAGVKQVVATAGTALTEQHLKALSLLTTDIRLCFDSDQAGLNATERAITLASKQKLNISIISLPKVKDPDELIRRNPSDWAKAIEQSEYAIDWLINYHKRQIDLSSAPGKRRFSDLLLPLIDSLSDDVERDHYLNLIAKLLEVSPSALSSKLSSIAKPKTRPRMPVKSYVELDRAAVERQKQQDNLLSLVLEHKSLRQYLDILNEDMMVNDNGKQLLAALKHSPSIDPKKDLLHFKELTDYVKIELLLYEELYAGLDISELKYEAARLRARLVESYTKSQKALITRGIRKADETTTRKLLGKAKQLDNLLNDVRRESEAYAEEKTS